MPLVRDHIPELCGKRLAQPGFSKREKNLNWRFAPEEPPASAQFRNCAEARTRVAPCRASPAYRPVIARRSIIT